MAEDKLEYTIGHSPDPDDAFMFYALTKGTMDTDDRNYTHVLLDIETLNKHAIKEENTKFSTVSIHSLSTYL